MATVSAYPLDRNKGTRGAAILRLRDNEVETLIRAKGVEYIKQNKFILRGTIKPFKCELVANEDGRKMVNHGRGRMQLILRFDDLTPLEPGDDLAIENIVMRIDGDVVAFMQTTETIFRQTRKHNAAKLALAAKAPEPSEPSRDLVKVETLASAVLKATESPTPREPIRQPIASQLEVDFVAAKELLNQLLAEHHLRLVTVEIKEDGTIGDMRLRPDDVIV